MNLTRRQLFKLVLLSMIGVILVGGMLVFYNFHKQTIDNELVTLDLVPKPEKLTELFFSNNANLPDSTTGNKPIRFAFVIHNLETTDYRYAYVVSVNANGTKYIVDSGNVLVKDNQYYVKNEQFKLLGSPGSQEVVVELTNKQQLIDFWISN